MLADKYHLLSLAVAERGYDIPAISDQFSQTQYLERAQELFGMNSKELTQYLWDNYNPSNIWILFSGVAVSASVLLLLYDKFILKGQANKVN
jgi:hypothetical protein